MNVSGIKAGRAFVLVEAVDATQKVLDRINMRVHRFASNMFRVGQSLFYGSAATLVPTAFALAGYARFDDAMKRVQARSYGTAQEMVKLRRQARQLAIDLGFPADQAGELMNKLAQAGYKRSEILQMAPATLKFARAAGDNNENDPTIAADILTSVLKSYELDASRSAYVADMLTMAANASKFSLDELGTSLAYALRPAKDFNLSLEDTLAMIAQMRDLGIDPSTVGSATRNIMLEFSDPERWGKFNKQLTAATGKMIQYKDAQGNLNSPPEILFAIGDAVKGLGSAEQSSLIQLLLGKRAYTPGLAIARGKNPFRDFQNLFKNGLGTVEKTSGTILEGLGKRFERFWSSVKDIVIGTGDSLQVAFESILQKGIEINGKFANWIENNGRLAISIIAVTAGIVTLGVALRIIAIPLTLLSYMFAIFLDLVALSFVPIRLLITLTIASSKAIYALGLALISLPLKAVSLLFSAAQLVITGTTTAITFCGAAITGLVGLFNLLVATGSAVMFLLTNLFGLGTGAAMAGMIGIPLIAIGAIVAGVYVLLNQLMGSVQTSFHKIRSEVVMMASSFKSWISGLAMATSDAFLAAGNVLIARLQNIWSTAQMIFNGVTDAMLAGDMEGAAEVATEGLKILWEETTHALLDTWNTFTDSLREPLLAAVRDIWKFLNDLLLRYKQAVIEVKYQVDPLTNPGRLVDEALGLSDTYLEEYNTAQKTARMERAKADSSADQFYTANKSRKQAISDSERDYSLAQKRAAYEAKIQSLQEKWSAEQKSRFDAMGNPAPAGVDHAKLDAMSKGLALPGSGNSRWAAIDWLQQGSVEAFDKSFKNRNQTGEDPLINLNSRQLTELEKMNETLHNMEQNEGF